MATVWNGTEAEGRALIEAISHNCACEHLPMGALKTVCTAHEAFARDQDWLNRLLYVYRIRDRFIAKEFAVDG